MFAHIPGVVINVHSMEGRRTTSHTLRCSCRTAVIQAGHDVRLMTHRTHHHHHRRHRHHHQRNRSVHSVVERIDGHFICAPAPFGDGDLREKRVHWTAKLRASVDDDDAGWAPREKTTFVFAATTATTAAANKEEIINSDDTYNERCLCDAA